MILPPEKLKLPISNKEFMKEIDEIISQDSEAKQSSSKTEKSRKTTKKGKGRKRETCIQNGVKGLKIASFSAYLHSKHFRGAGVTEMHNIYP